MRELGANLIRLQLPHYFFEPISNPGSYREAAFTQLNTWIGWAEQEQLYLLIDMHVPYGGRQYNGVEPEGDTIWSSESEKGYVISLWREIVSRTKTHYHVLYEIMNEPDPVGAETTTDEWWNLAQEIVNTIRTEEGEGYDHILVIPCPLELEGGEQPFRILEDNENHNLAYDFHFYKPIEFTHQKATWTTKWYPEANYPYEDLKWVCDTQDTDWSSKFQSSDTWSSWSETLLGSDLIQEGVSHFSPRYKSYDNEGPISFDNCHVQIQVDGQNIVKDIFNNEFEDGSGSFPDGWDQWGNNEDEKAAFWDEESGNHFVTIPPTGELKTRFVRPTHAHALELPDSYETIDGITVQADVRGSNSSPSKVFGISWYTTEIYDRTKMIEDIQDYLDFRKKNNVPIMCLELGVIMEATEEQGHLKWLNDSLSLLARQNIHWAYHSWRSYSDDPDKNSFGIYQCWGLPARECGKQFTFVLPVLRQFMNPSTLPGILNLLLF
ncbi:MAG TPA: cellulase family glycosylhydrolase [Syntrophales bacterium]|nr:cellulase family glycosylhydrolase [Syntrophales bacterium]